MHQSSGISPSAVIPTAWRAAFPYPSLSGKMGEALTHTPAYSLMVAFVGEGCPVQGPWLEKYVLMSTIELFGVPRLRAGRGSVTLDAPTLEQALDELGQARGGRAQSADRPALRRPGVVAVRNRGKARGNRRPGDHRRMRDTECGLRGRDGDRRAPSRVASLWGLPAREAEDRLRDEHGKEWQVAAIGPAGERLTPFVTLSGSRMDRGRPSPTRLTPRTGSGWPRVRDG